MTHICVSKKHTIICSDYGLSPGRRQAIIWTNAGILLIRTSGTNFSEILIRIHTFSFMKIHLKMSSVKWRQYCLGLNVLNKQSTSMGCIYPVFWKIIDCCTKETEMSACQWNVHHCLCQRLSFCQLPLQPVIEIHHHDHSAWRLHHDKISISVRRFYCSQT